MPPTVLRSRSRRTDRLTEALLDLGMIVWPHDDAAGNLRTLGGTWPGTMTGSPTYGVAARDPIGRGITYSGSGQFATASTSFPNPTTGLSVLSVIATTSASASNRAICARGAGGTGQGGHSLQMTAAHALMFKVFQADGTDHASATVSGAVNDGAIHLLAGTFDGTTITAYRDLAAPATSTSLTGSWGKASTAALRIANLNGGFLFPGTVYRNAVGIDRVLTASDISALVALATGG